MFFTEVKRMTEIGDASYGQAFKAACSGTPGSWPDAGAVVHGDNQACTSQAIESTGQSADIARVLDLIKGKEQGQRRLGKFLQKRFQAVKGKTSDARHKALMGDAALIALSAAELVEQIVGNALKTNGVLAAEFTDQANLLAGELLPAEHEIYLFRSIPEQFKYGFTAWKQTVFLQAECICSIMFCHHHISFGPGYS